jgi:anti-sigma B factor antagonist
MSVTLEQRENGSLIRLEGTLTLASAGELKELLLQWLGSGENLELDLDRAEYLDITVMQLLQAAGREAARAGARIVTRSSDAVIIAMRDAGFVAMPGFPTQE